MTDEAMSPLRRRMIEDMTIRKLAPKTQQGYIRTIRDFAAFLGRSPDTASFEDVRRFQLHLAANGAHVPILNHAVAALRFFFRVTLRRSDIIEHTTFIHEPRKLPVVLSAEEVARLLDAAPGLKYKAALSVAYGAGLRAAEVISLKIGDGNSDTYGGAGGANATASGGNALSALITPHELGHSLGGLQDEYDYLARGARGEPYTGTEPASTHHTLLTVPEMRAQQKKWWRWLGEPSESGGSIARYESGMYAGSGVWRPSAHSMMKTLGYYFDQISREQMTQRISAKTSILQDGVPAGVVGADRVLWIETMYPVSHQLDVTWTVNGTVVARGTRSLPTKELSGTVTATVVDPTEFVRDPAIRATPALTQSRTWTVDTSLTTPVVPVAPAFTVTTPTTSPVGGTDVVYAETTHPTDHVPVVSWRLDGRSVAPGANDRALDLEPLRLKGKHTLTATVGDETRTWTVDAKAPSASYELSEPLLAGRDSYVYNGPFTMSLAGNDDTPGYVVREFRTDGDGWFNYFGWPTDPDAPFRFTPQGTEIDSLVYGKLGVPRLSPWDNVPTSYGTHTIEYRSVDPAGNTGKASSFDVTLLPEPPACTRTITGRHNGPLVVREGVTCLKNAKVTGPVTVGAGASVVATAATIEGPLLATRAATVELFDTTVSGPLTITGTTGEVQVLDGTVRGPATLAGNQAPVFAGVTVRGPLSCTGNAKPPTDLNIENTVHGPSLGQCR